jgi:SnoaL-like polyketide cyclase
VSTVEQVLSDPGLTEQERANVRLVLHFRTLPFAERSKYTVPGFKPSRMGMANLAEVKDPAAPAYNAESIPDREDEMLDIIASGDRVWATWHIRGTHLGDMYGLPASGRTLCVTEIGQWRIEGGLIAEAWFLVDELALLRQVGAWSGLIDPTVADPTHDHSNPQTKAD